MNLTAAMLSLMLVAAPGRPRKANADELRAASETLKVSVDDLDEAQSFAVDALGPHTLFVSIGCGALALVRDQKVLLQTAPDRRCRATLDAVAFKDVDRDGRTDVVVLGHDPNSITERLNPFGTVLLQQADGTFRDEAQRLDWSFLRGRDKVTLKDIEQAWKRGTAKAPRPRP